MNTPELHNAIKVEYMTNEMLYGEVVAKAKLAIRLGCRLLVPNIETLDVCIRHGVQPSMLIVETERTKGE